MSLADIRNKAKMPQAQSQGASGNKPSKSVKIVEKEDIIKKVAKESRFPQKYVRIILDETLSQIQQNLKKGHDVRFLFFGRFRIKNVKGGVVQHILTKQKVSYPPSIGVGFKASDTLKKKIRAGHKKTQG
jgi:nucleoid DNA-binding protein